MNGFARFLLWIVAIVICCYGLALIFITLAAILDKALQVLA